MPTSPRVQLFGLPVDSLTMGEAVGRVEELIRFQRSHRITVVNANKLWQASRDPTLAGIIRDSDMVIPEWAVVWAANVLGTPLRGHVGGITLTQELLPVAARAAHPVFFLGARPEVLEALVASVRRLYPTLRIAGTHHGYFGLDDQAVPRLVRDARPALLFVAMGSPRQEYWLERFQRDMEVPVSIGVGGTFDVLAGLKRDAPAWARGRGLEWLVRLAQDPANLWRRYLVTNTWFVWQVARARLLHQRNGQRSALE